MENNEVKSWLEVSLTVDAEIAEAASEVLSRYCENGVVVERGMDYNDAEDIGTPFGPCHVYGYLPMDDEVEEKKSQISQALWHLGFISEIPEPEFKIIEDQDWMSSWKKFYRPIPIGKKMLILPAWVEQEDQDRIPLRIDPSMAFGTGTHPTTQLCLALAEEYVQPGIDVIDVGCGSGILSIGSILLGAKYALGVDIDPESMNRDPEGRDFHQACSAGFGEHSCPDPADALRCGHGRTGGSGRHPRAQRDPGRPGGKGPQNGRVQGSDLPQTHAGQRLGRDVISEIRNKK